MRTASVAVAGAAIILLLTGCAASVAPSEPKAAEPTAAPSPTPTIALGPVELTKEEAADRYLGLVCQRNILNERIYNAFVAHEEDYFNGGTPDVTELKAAGTEGMRVNRLVLELIDDAYYTWPEGIDEHLQVIRQSYLAESSYNNNLANAQSYEVAYNTPTPDGSAGSSAAQEIRYQLGLPADTTASCQGKETYSDTLHAQMIERNEYLASFTEKDIAEDVAEDGDEA